MAQFIGQAELKTCLTVCTVYKGLFLPHNFKTCQAFSYVNMSFDDDKCFFNVPKQCGNVMWMRKEKLILVQPAIKSGKGEISKGELLHTIGQ